MHTSIAMPNNYYTKSLMLLIEKNADVKMEKSKFSLTNLQHHSPLSPYPNQHKSSKHIWKG